MIDEVADLVGRAADGQQLVERARRLKPYAGSPGMGMFRYVAKRFLCDPVKAKFDVVRDFGPSIGDLDIYLPSPPSSFRHA
ncbi:hypothetical protein [Mesorhizobium amorphae]|uniref:hypothetical protein n=1 Tax=Mesorhizobium amorphae TaxID=71433 RepID=UPI001781CFFF|nr:hypothetical protein [Mesorhizobium amorphae]